jgi:hypothetical protein
MQGIEIPANAGEHVYVTFGDSFAEGGFFSDLQHIIGFPFFIKHGDFPFKEACLLSSIPFSTSVREGL